MAWHVRLRREGDGRPGESDMGCWGVRPIGQRQVSMSERGGAGYEVAAVHCIHGPGPCLEQLTKEITEVVFLIWCWHLLCCWCKQINR